MPNAWITLATNDGYAVGALVLAHSLKQVGTQHDIHVMYTDGVSIPLRNQLEAVFTHTSLVNVLDSNDHENLALIGRPDLGQTFTKLHAFRLTQYEKAVFLDADTLVLQNADELFDRPSEPISAAADIGWPDYFNSGVFVFKPSLETYRQLVQFGLQEGSFDGGDQGLLNKWYSNWRDLDSAHRLPFIYNMTAGAIYSYAAALKLHGGNVKIVHFLGRQKPWHSLKTGVHDNEHWTVWHGIFEQNVKQHLPPSLLVCGFTLSDDVSTSLTATNGSAEKSEEFNRIACYWYDTHSETKTHHKPHHSNKHHQAREVESYKSAEIIEQIQHHESPPTTVEKIEFEPASQPNITVHVNDEAVVSSSSSSCCCEPEIASDSEESESENKWDRALNDWERGQPDVEGRDAFDNIMSHIQSQLE